MKASIISTENKRATEQKLAFVAKHKNRSAINGVGTNGHTKGQTVDIITELNMYVINDRDARTSSHKN